MTLLAVFDLLIYRHTGQRDLLIGSPASGRSSALFSDTVGYFVNPIVTRTKLSGQMTFTELLAHVRQVVLQAFAHQDYPFNLLVNKLQAERDPARSALFQVMFALQKARRPEEEALAAFALGEADAAVDLGGLRLESMALDQRVAQFDLTLTMAEIAGSLRAAFEYCTDLFEEATIKRLAEHFRVLLNEIVANPSRSLDDFNILTRAENEQLLRDENDTAPLPPVTCVHKSFELQAAANPNQIAVVCGHEQLTYRELNARSNQLARHLRSLGVGPGSRVGLGMGRSIELLIGLLSILKAEAAYVPLDMAYPQQRLAFMVQDTAASVLLTTRKDLQALPAGAGQVVLLDEHWPLIEHESEANLDAEADANSPAYVIYTSGSSGVPKGIPVNHGSLAHYIRSVSSELGISDHDRLLQFSSFSFDVSLEEIFSSLTRGATLVLRSEEMASSTRELLRVCRDQRPIGSRLRPCGSWSLAAKSYNPLGWRNGSQWWASACGW
jgi:non-ribosomal peptide synthetase component F